MAPIIYIKKSNDAKWVHNPDSLLIYSQTNHLKEDSALNNQHVTNGFIIDLDSNYSDLFGGAHLKLCDNIYKQPTVPLVFELFWHGMIWNKEIVMDLENRFIESDHK